MIMICTLIHSNMRNSIFISSVLDRKYISWANLFRKSKLSIFHHGMWRFQNETDVLKKVNLRRQIFLKKCQMFLLHILNYKRCLKQFIRLITNIYQYNNSTSLFHTIVLFVCPIKTKMFMFNFLSLIFK